MIKIDKGVPMTDSRSRTSVQKYPWRDMRPGDSFFVPNAGHATTRDRKPGFKIFHAGFGKRIHPGSRWVTRAATVDGVTGLRVWRLS